MLQGYAGLTEIIELPPDGAAGLVLTKLSSANYDVYWGPSGGTIGGGITGGTAGSVLFVNPTGILAQDNANFFWDDTNNRLGLGNAAPASTLTVKGSGAGLVQIGQLSDATSYGAIGFQSTVAAANYALAGASDGQLFINVISGQVMNFQVGNANKMMMDAQGRFGINCTPFTTLTVMGAANSLGGTGFYNTACVQDQTNYRGFLMGFDTSGQIGVIMSGTSSTAVKSQTAFWGCNGAAYTEFMRLNGDGNFGIGTTNPLQRLHIVSNTANIQFGNYSSGIGSIGFGATLTTANFALAGSTTQTYINTPTGGLINFQVNNTAVGAFSSSDLKVGTGSVYFQVNPNFVGTGELLAGAYMSTDAAGNMSFAAAAGASGKKTVIAYYDQTSWYSAAEVANTASGFGTLALMKSGGSVAIGQASAAWALDVNGAIAMRGASATMFWYDRNNDGTFGACYRNAGVNYLYDGVFGNTISWSPAGTVVLSGSTATVKASLGGASATDNYLNVTGTLPSSLSAQTSGVVFNITTAGSSVQEVDGLAVNLKAGYTGAGYPIAGAFVNSVAGTGANNNLGGVANYGIYCDTSASTVGTNIGLYAAGRQGNLSMGVVGAAPTTKNSGINVGVVGMAANAGTTPTIVGGFFGLGTSYPTFASTALLCDNGSQALPIFIARDNGTAVFSIIDGGNVGVGVANPSSLLEIKNSFYLGFRDAANSGTAVFLRANASDGCEFVTSAYATPILIDASTIQLNANGSTGNVGVGIAPSGNGRLQVKSGAAATMFSKVGGTIAHFIADVGNVGTGEDDLFTTTLAAAMLTNNGDSVSATYQGLFVGAAASTQEVKVYFGGTAIYASGALAIGVATNNWTITVMCIRVSSSVVRCSVALSTDFGTLFPYSKYTEVTGLTLTNTQILKLTGEAAGVGAVDNMVIAKLGKVSWASSA